MYFSFKIIFCALLLINSILCYDPANRSDHNSSFDNNNLAWTLIPEGSLPVYTERSTAVLSLDNSTIYLYGGYMRNKITLDYDYSNLDYTYNNAASTWSTPVLGVVPPRQTIYIFGGFNATNLATYTKIFLFDVLNIRLIFLPNGIIVYIGGIEQIGSNDFTLVNMNEITTGDIDSRVHHTSVLTPDGYIIVFGGRTFTYTITQAKILSNGPFHLNSPPPIWGHTAHLFNDYMITTFGAATNTGSCVSLRYKN
ncbi:hypothetical protein Glove_461g41 [Diversispora epigaea]|uniref:Galactose oxidase n=1 Tax=Diversispora epigaea TaxID=1348612 RepID=A0A397GWL3_9GLOM|nr:hypothetical protein Glove_461g41 [Diversispora epigaea]